MVEEPEAKVQISIHVERPVREQLEAAAKRAVRSLSGEISWRLQRSLEAELNASTSPLMQNSAG